MRTLLSLALFLILTFAIFCASDNQENSIDINLKLLDRYGKLDGTDDEVIGAIGRFTVDQFENIYLIDRAFKHVKKFSKSGSVVRIFGNGEGKGPGEFIAPHDIDVDLFGNIYVVDRSRYNISLFDSTNKLLKTVHTSFMPAQIVITNPSEAYVTGFLFSVENDIIKKFNFFQKQYDKPILSFCRLNSCRDSLAIVWSGNSGNLARDAKGSLYYSFFYPYEIMQFSSDGKVTKKLTRNDDDFEPPYFKNNRVLFTTGSKGLLTLPNNIIANLVLKIKNERFNFQLDFFNVETNKFLGTVLLANYGIENVTYIESDPHGNIYIATSIPYPQILKYKLTLEQMEI